MTTYSLIRLKETGIKLVKIAEHSYWSIPLLSMLITFAFMIGAVILW